jgi:hypothetical protein
VKLPEKTCSSDVRRLEVEEDEVWFEYCRANREHIYPDRTGFEDGTKGLHKRALALNRPHTQIMLLYRQRIFGMVRDG